MICKLLSTSLSTSRDKISDSKINQTEWVAFSNLFLGSSSSLPSIQSNALEVELIIFIKHYTEKCCWITTDVHTAVDCTPNPPPSPVQEIIIHSLWLPSCSQKPVEWWHNQVCSSLCSSRITIHGQFIPRGSVRPACDLTKNCEVSEGPGQPKYRPQGKASHTPFCETLGFQGQKERTEHRLMW